MNDFLGDAEQRITTLETNLAIEQALLETYKAQLAEELLILKSGNTTSIDALAGMTLAEALAFVEEHKRAYEANYLAATIALGEFDKTYDLDLIADQEKGLRQRIAADQLTLLTIADDIAGEQVRLEWQLAELEKHPERNVFTQALLDNPLMAEGVRREDGAIDLPALPGLAIQVEELNPQHASLRSNALSTQLRLTELEAKRDTLAESVASLSHQADALRTIRIELEIERSQLSESREEERTMFDKYMALGVSLAVPGERLENHQQIIGLDRTEVAQLRGSVRESEQRITRLETELSQLLADRTVFAGRAAILRSEIADINLEQRQLERFVSQQREAYNGVARLQPIMDLFGDLAPGNARVLNPAVVPEASEGGKLQPTIIAIVVGGLLATMFAFLREAIRDPNEERGVVTSRPATG